MEESRLSEIDTHTRDPFGKFLSRSCDRVAFCGWGIGILSRKHNTKASITWDERRQTGRKGHSYIVTEREI